ncbi:MAG: sulfatase-like hydrolase/transferase [Acidimicrobiales bacterium]
MLRRRPAPAPPTAPSITASPAADAEGAPPPSARHLVIVVLDSLRYDSWLAADTPNLDRLGPVERRWSYASWTAPSHYNLLTGLLPHASPTQIYASEHYKADYLRYNERLGIEGIEFKSLLPTLYLPTLLKSLGYRTHARVSMPVLNPYTGINRDFDSYQLMPVHNDMAAMLETLDFDADGHPSFWLLNVGETHYPYALPDEDPADWPRVSGVHGVVKALADEADPWATAEPAAFDQEELDRLRARQVRALSYLDGVFDRLFRLVPRNTWLIVTSDHGELFGEDGYFGHGPIAHAKVLEVPFVEGLVP